MQVKLVKKGKHKFNPSELHPFTYNNGKIYTTSFAARFHQSCEVDVYEGNDDSWNKLSGVAWNLLNSTKNSVMVGWRYAPQLKSKLNKSTVFELCAYWHSKDGSVNYSEPLYTVNTDELFYVDFIVNRIDNTVSVGFERERSVPDYSNEYSLFKINVNSPEPNTIARRINPWFGGQKPALENVTLQCSRFSDIVYINDTNPTNLGNKIANRNSEYINNI